MRFVCELGALYGIGAGAWAWTDSVLAGVAFPVVAATLWGVFRVPDDRGPPPVAVPGPVRLTIEGAVFGGGALGLWMAHGAPAGMAFAVIVVLHYATTAGRLRHVWSCREGHGQLRSSPIALSLSRAGPSMTSSPGSPPRSIATSAYAPSR